MHIKEELQLWSKPLEGLHKTVGLVRVAVGVGEEDIIMEGVKLCHGELPVEFNSEGHTNLGASFLDLRRISRSAEGKVNIA